MIAKPLWPAGIALLALLGAHVSDVGSRDSALQAFLADPSRGISRIAERYGVAAEQCADERADSFYPLAAAFLTIETLVTPRLEGWARAGLVYAAGTIGMTPDISIGPGRIRPNTARMALQQATSSEARRYADLSAPALAKMLLRPCDALRVAAAILDHIRRQSGDPHADVDRKFIRAAAAIYNGQSAAMTSAEAKLSAEIYLELVYDAYQHYRFLTATANAAKPELVPR